MKLAQNVLCAMAIPVESTALAHFELRHCPFSACFLLLLSSKTPHFAVLDAGLYLTPGVRTFGSEPRSLPLMPEDNGGV
jgi:hypothetical protein